MRDRTIQYLVGAGSPTKIAKNKQSHKPARPTRDLHSHFTNKFAVHLFGWWGGGGFLRLLIFVMNVGEPAPTAIMVDLLDTILIANI